MKVRKAAFAAFVCALVLVPSEASAPPPRPPLDPGSHGARSLEALRREPITFELDVAYAGDGNPRHRLDLFLPAAGASDPLPVIVFLHGGGWRQGDKAQGVENLLPFLRTGRYAGVSAGYRLTGEATWPAQIHDVKAAIRWVRANARTRGLDPDRIAVWGRSAGGHLALMLGMSGDEPALEGDVGPYDGTSSRVAAVVNFFGITDLTAVLRQPRELDRRSLGSLVAQLLGGPLRDDAEGAKAASPIAYVTANAPPVLTVHGTADRVVPYDQAVRLDAALRAAGVPSFFVTIEGGGHGDFGTAAEDRMAAFLERMLLGKPVAVPTTPIEWHHR